jgi:hypothetical protein
MLYLDFTKLRILNWLEEVDKVDLSREDIIIK